MNFEEFDAFLRESCMYEAIYDDSEGRRILVIRELDAFCMVAKAVAAEREACAKVCETQWSTGEEKAAGLLFAAEIRARSKT